MGLLVPCFVPRGGVLYTVIVTGEGFCPLRVMSRGMEGFAPFESCPGGDGFG